MKREEEREQRRKDEYEVEPAMGSKRRDTCETKGALVLQHHLTGGATELPQVDIGDT
jgi:hypothetical protein